MGHLAIEVLNPEDAVIGRLDRTSSRPQAAAFGEQDVTIPGALPVDDLVWHRLRYRFTYQGGQAAALQRITSISRILRRPVVHVLGQQSYLTGGAAAVRLIVTEGGRTRPWSLRGRCASNCSRQGQKPQALYTGRLNDRGTTGPISAFPRGLAGSYSLRYIAETAIGEAEHTQQIRLEDKASILLTTEKPVYQPGQTIHVRALALDRASHQAAADRQLTFEVEDSRGNKVFRKATQTDTYGIASAEFSLADEVNLGAYHLRALMDDGERPTRPRSRSTSSATCCPRFKVDVDLAGNDAQSQTRLSPGRSRHRHRPRQLFLRQAGGSRGGRQSKLPRWTWRVSMPAQSRAKPTPKAPFVSTFACPISSPASRSATALPRVLIEATVKDNAGHSRNPRRAGHRQRIAAADHRRAGKRQRWFRVSKTRFSF